MSEAEGERPSKLKVVYQGSLESQRRIAQLEEEVETLHQTAERQDAAMKEAQLSFEMKQKELDECIEEVMNWVPIALTQAHQNHLAAYRRLRRTRLQLMDCQLKLNIPISLDFSDESSETDPTELDSTDSINDISYVMARELLRTKEYYTQRVASLEERIASLEAQLNEIDADRARDRADSLSGKISSAEIDDQKAKKKTRTNNPEILDYGTIAMRTPGHEVETLLMDDHSKPSSETDDIGDGSDSRLIIAESVSEVVVNSSGREASVLSTSVNENLVPANSPLQYPRDAEGVQWFKDAFEFLNVDLGVPYTAFVKLYIEFERVSGWQTGRLGLPKLNRPSELNDWISYGRYSKKKIVISPEMVEDFKARFMGWWASLQPKWRQVAGGNGLVSSASHSVDDWKSLDYSGKNGWLSLLAGIRWWGETLTQIEEPERSKRIDEWLAAIDDMSSMLHGLISFKRRSLRR